MVNREIFGINGISSNALGKVTNVNRFHHMEKNHYTVKVPKGKYYLERRLYVQSNTTLVLTGVTFKPRLGMGAMIELGNRESKI